MANLNSGPSQHQPGAFPLFQLWGIRVSIHWSWLIVAVILINRRFADFENHAWDVVVYLSLFAIVLMHEFGHALACRSVGGEANRIMLWPLGGVAYVSPPPRAGAYLWSIVAGPLVNAVLAPILFGISMLYESNVTNAGQTDVGLYLMFMSYINLGLLIFNMLPIYPLDGGQTLRGILWLFLGPIRSLSIAARIGLVAAIAFGAVAAFDGDLWLLALAVFAAYQCFLGIQQAQWLRSILANPPRTSSGRPDGFSGGSAGDSALSVYTPVSRQPIPIATPVLAGRAGAHCPKCHRPAPVGPLWQCDCGRQFDLFAENARCPECQSLQTVVGCPYCGEFSPTSGWQATGS